MTHLFQAGKFILASGRQAFWKIECDALTPADWEGLARMAIDLLPPFGRVLGVPTGGLKFAVALGRYRIEGHPRVLIADDVWTTGGSMRRTADGAQLTEWTGVVAFARGPLAPNVAAVWRLHGVS